ncbi:MAG: DoxX family protein [Proteobacteria bacterium]|nr:DoxX family protein [Pseudomonadota bacterium]MCP4917367.1 DoxX family protein [Pseudomonadota bacterium]
MKKAFLAVTVLFSLAIVPGVIGDLLQPEMVVDVMEVLGLPGYVLTLVGLWKIGGIIAMWIPKMPRVTEWAYAGFFFFDLTGAAWAHGASVDYAGIAPPLGVLALGAASYFLRRRAEADTAAA